MNKTNNKTLDEIISRAISEPEFRQKLLVDAELALQEAGYGVDDAVLKTLHEIKLGRPEELASMEDADFPGSWGELGNPMG